jgi:hypothetical protein
MLAAETLQTTERTSDQPKKKTKKTLGSNNAFQATSRHRINAL